MNDLVFLYVVFTLGLLLLCGLLMVITAIVREWRNAIANIRARRALGQSYASIFIKF